jgi:hypothetical protein
MWRSDLSVNGTFGTFFGFRFYSHPIVRLLGSRAGSAIAPEFCGSLEVDRFSCHSGKQVSANGVSQTRAVRCASVVNQV